MINIEGPKSRDFDLLHAHFDLAPLEKAFWDGYRYMILGLAPFDRGTYQAWECVDEDHAKEKVLGSKYLELTPLPHAEETHVLTKNVLVFKTKKLAQDMLRDSEAGPHLNHHEGILHLVYNPEEAGTSHYVHGKETLY